MPIADFRHRVRRQHVGGDRFPARDRAADWLDLLLDVNNMFVSAVNHGFDPDRYLADFPLEAVSEIHLASYPEDTDDAGQPLLIDARNSPVRDAAWSLYAAAIRRLGATPG
jgi:uncharacterized protein